MASERIATIMPATDILERADGYYIFVDMPGLSSEELSIDLEQNELTVKGHSRYVPSPGNKDQCMRTEFAPVSYQRVFTLSDMVDAGKIKAVMKDGVLELYLPKAESMKPRRIEIKTESM